MLISDHKCMIWSILCCSCV